MFYWALLVAVRAARRSMTAWWQPGLLKQLEWMSWTYRVALADSPRQAEQEYFAPLVEALKQVAGIPVILTGGIKDAKVADQLLQERKADLIGVGRAIMSDSLWTKRAVERLRGI